jgi:triosephosphate isomerase
MCLGLGIGEAMRSYYIAGNWKMNKTPSEAVALAETLVKDLKDCKEKVLIAPAFVALDAVAKVVKGTNIRLGAQNMGPEESGAFTGEVSPLMLKELGVQTVILGHSEPARSSRKTTSLSTRSSFSPSSMVSRSSSA